MKKLFYTIAFCLFLVAVFQQPVMAQSPQPTEYDDLAPFPFDDKKPAEKKTFGEKLKKTLNHENVTPDTVAKSPDPDSEEYIRFYEFKDITFSEEENEEIEYKPMDPVEDKEDTYTYRIEPYRDVTFGDNTTTTTTTATTEPDQAEYDDEPYQPYRMRLKRDDAERRKYYNSDSEPDEVQRNTPVRKALKPVAIKDKDFYRQDYIYYYYHRKKKGNGEPSDPVYFSDEINKTKKRILDRMEEN
ncbi:MAG: hypothetical protein AAFZ15_07500 [Bacteroidota bacterium]